MSEEDKTALGAALDAVIKPEMDVSPSATLPVAIRWPVAHGMISYNARSEYVISVAVGPPPELFNPTDPQMRHQILHRRARVHYTGGKSRNDSSNTTTYGGFRVGHIEALHTTEFVCPRHRKVQQRQNVEDRMFLADRGVLRCPECNARMQPCQPTGNNIDHGLERKLLAMSLYEHTTPAEELLPSLWGVWTNETLPAEWSLPPDAPTHHRKLVSAWAMQGCSVLPFEILRALNRRALRNAVSIVALPAAPITVGYMSVRVVSGPRIELGKGNTAATHDIEFDHPYIPARVPWRTLGTAV